MTLRVPIERFSDTVRRVLGTDEAYVAAAEGGALATAFSAVKRVRVLSSGAGTVDELVRRLSEEGLRVERGQWIAPEEAQPEAVRPVPFVAAVAYATAGPQPGVWIDAYEHQPTPAQALRALYDEFRDTGELGEVAFEEFVRQANPTVVVVSPTELWSFAGSKES